MDEWIDGWMKWMNECIGDWMDGWLNEWTNERMNELMDEWTNERMNELMDEWTEHERTSSIRSSSCDLLHMSSSPVK